MKLKGLSVLAFLIALSGCQSVKEGQTLNRPGDGFRGLWYYNQRLDSEYKFKYSGGLGTYTAKHKPLAVYSPEVNKTFFCFGGVTEGFHLREDLHKDSIGRLEPENGILHMVSAYDHATKTVSRPTIILDKKTYDAHDNPVITLDSDGYIWILSTAHGRMRPAYVHKSVRPWDETEFEKVQIYKVDNEATTSIDNFSYMQVWHTEEQGFVYFFTLYTEAGERKTFYANSQDGEHWENWVRLAAIEKGHYQISGVYRNKAASSFNYHPQEIGLNARTNLYYVETSDRGKNWTNAAGESVSLPLTESINAALVHDYESEGLLVYMKDITFNSQGHPLILFITSRGFESGPDNDPRTWRLARWTGNHWQLSDITQSDNNYDMGSLYLETDTRLRVIAPTEKGPQGYNPGGEVALWMSEDSGQTWALEKQLTNNSPYNHTYIRRPVNAQPEFYAFWADGHAREPSPSKFYFSNQSGEVFELPETMKESVVSPKRLKTKR